jgi:hypothetical protein
VSHISYQVFENMNRRTAEQRTAEYRSEKHCLIALLSHCFQELLLFEIPCSIFDIQDRKQAESRSKRD